MECQVYQEDLNSGRIHIVAEGKIGLRKTLGPRTLKVPTRKAAKRMYSQPENVFGQQTTFRPQAKVGTMGRAEE